MPGRCLIRLFGLFIVVAVGIAGCGFNFAAPSSRPSVKVVVAGGQVSVVVASKIVEPASLSTQAIVERNHRGLVHHITLSLFKLEGGLERAVPGPDGRAVSVTLEAAELSSSVEVAGLAFNSTYRIKGVAFKGPGDSPNDKISEDALSFVDVSVGQDTAPISRVIEVHLANTPFSAQQDSGVLIHAGKLLPQGPERASLVVQPYWLSTLAGTPSAGFLDADLANSAFSAPADIAIAPNGAVYVADTGNHRIRAIVGNEVLTLAGGSAGFADGLWNVAQFDTPTGISVEASGSVLVADTANCKIRRVLRDGTVTTVAGSSCGYLDGPADQSQFQFPTGIAISPSGDIAVADTGNNCIRLISGGVVQTIAGATTSGFVDGSASEARFNQPAGIEFNPLTQAFVVADSANNAIRAVTNGIVTTLAGTGEYGDTDGLPGSSRFDGPTDVAIDSAGRIFVADTNNHVIRLIDHEVSTIAGSGWEGYADGLGTSSRLSAPEGLAIADGKFFLSDTGNHVIRALSLAP